MDIDERAQILKYARHHNLISESAQDDLDAGIEGFVPLDHRYNLIDLDDTARLQDISLVDEAAERLDLSADARGLLHTVLVKDAALTEIDWQLYCGHHKQHLKFEAPLLRTDHDLDVRRFRKSAAVGELDKTLLSTLVSDGQDEAVLSWPIEMERFWQQYDYDPATEKLDIPRDSFSLLKEVLSPGDSQQILDVAIKLESRYHRNQKIDTLTPPLSPLPKPFLATSHLGPESSSSPLPEFGTSHLDKCSTSEELAKLNQDILDADQISFTAGASFFKHGNAGRASIETSSSGPAKWDIETQSSSPLIRAKSQGLKLDEPLSAASPQKTAELVAFSDVLEDVSTIVGPWQIENEARSDDAESEYEKIFNNMIEAKALQVEHEINNEQLQQAGIDTRIPVPSIDLSRPRASWSKASDEAMTAEEICELTVPISKMSLHCWPGLSKYDRGSGALPWSPFPMRLAEVPAYEILEHAEDVADFIDMRDYENVLTSADLTWKPDGVRILDENADDEELEPAQFDQDAAFQRILRKRKLAIQDVDESNVRFPPKMPSVTSLRKDQASVVVPPIQQSRPFDAQPDDSMLQRPEHESLTQNHGVHSIFDAQDSLTRFMETQGHAPKKQRLSQPRPSAPPVSAQTNIQQQPTSAFSNSLPPPAPISQFAAPGIPHTLGNRNIVISSNLMRASRPLVRHITTLHPSLDFIERDWSARIPLMLDPSCGDKGPKSLHQHEYDEGDVQISPSTCLIITTLQKIKQKPLPGQGSEILLRARVRAVAARFETLLVLVGIGDGGAAPLDRADCAALTSLMGYCVGLKDDVVVYPVAGGDEDMAKWVVGLLGQTGCGKDVRLLGDETLWELFLRRAGANAFAAQAVLASLKRPEGDRETLMDAADLSATLFGLPAFVTMDAEARSKIFERVLGGSKILNRVSRLIDAEWSMVQSQTSAGWLRES